MRKTIFAAMLLACSFLSTAHAQHLWGGAVIGMSVEEAESKVKGATRSVDGMTLINGAVEKLHVPGLEIARKEFTAHLFYKGEGLTLVMLSPTQELDERGAISLFEQLRTALRSKYGNEIESKDGEYLNFHTLAWATDEIDVELIHFYVGEPPIVRVVYHTQMRETADKL